MSYDRARQKSRAAIEAAMHTLMRTRPLSRITVTEICQLCGLNRSTFYAYYPTIDHLIREMHTTLFLQMEEYLHLSPQTYGTRDKELFTSFLVHVCQEDERFCLYLRSGQPTLFAQHMVDHFLTRLCPKDATIARRNAQLYHMVGAFTLLCAWISEGFPCPAEELAEQILALTAVPN